jgi:Tfp pilus assembly PilM family ATPase
MPNEELNEADKIIDKLSTTPEERQRRKVDKILKELDQEITRIIKEFMGTQ